METAVWLLGALALTALVAAWQSWRDREHRYDVALLALTGAGFGASALVVAA